MLGLEIGDRGQLGDGEARADERRRRQAARRRRRRVSIGWSASGSSGSRTAKPSIVRPKLIEAFNDIRQYGVATDKLIDLHEQIAPLIDQISGLLVQAGVEEVVDRIKPGVALPPDTEVAELITMLVRFRTQAVSAVSATLAFSIESTIETAVGQILGDLIDKEAPPES